MFRSKFLLMSGLIRFNQAPAGSEGAGGAGGSTGDPKQTPSPWEQMFAGMKPEDVKKALDASRKWEERAKDNLAAAQERDALKAAADQSKSETQKLTERLAALEAENEAAKAKEQVQAWAKEIVKDSKVPADALRGSTEEELRAHFEQLKGLIGDQSAGGEGQKKGATAPYVPNAGQAPTAGEDNPTSTRPGIGTLRDAYAEAEAERSQ